MKTSEVIQTIGIPINQLYYLEQKGYVVPIRRAAGDRETLDYTIEDVEKIRLIWKYLQQGFKHKITYLKAVQEISLK